MSGPQPEERPTWQRRRTESRGQERAKRLAAHREGLRARARSAGPKAVAAAEWDILRGTVARLPEGLRDGEWLHLAALLGQLSARLDERHTP